MVKKEMRKKAKRRTAVLSRRMLGLVRGKEDDDGFFRTATHVTTNDD